MTCGAIPTSVRFPVSPRGRRAARSLPGRLLRAEDVPAPPCAASWRLVITARPQKVCAPGSRSPPWTSGQKQTSLQPLSEQQSQKFTVRKWTVRPRNLVTLSANKFVQGTFKPAVSCANDLQMTARRESLLAPPKVPLPGTPDEAVTSSIKGTSRHCETGRSRPGEGLSFRFCVTVANSLRQQKPLIAHLGVKLSVVVFFMPPQIQRLVVLVKCDPRSGSPTLSQATLLKVRQGRQLGWDLRDSLQAEDRHPEGYAMMNLGAK